MLRLKMLKFGIVIAWFILFCFAPNKWFKGIRLLKRCSIISIRELNVDGANKWTKNKPSNIRSMSLIAQGFSFCCFYSLI